MSAKLLNVSHPNEFHVSVNCVAAPAVIKPGFDLLAADPDLPV